MENLTKTEFEKMVEAATKKGFKVWTGKGEYYDYTGQIGIETKKAIVYWYDIHDGDLLYNHVYNCNNGKTTKGFTIGFNFKYKMIYKNS